MQRDRLVHTNLFKGGLDMDSDPREIQVGDYIDALNFRTNASENGLEGVGENISSNAQVPYTLYTTDGAYNRCVGVYEDKVFNTVFYFIWNSAQRHKILRYFPVTNTIELIFDAFQQIQQLFVLDPNKYVNHINLVQNKLLYWTYGEAQQKINIEKASDNGGTKLVDFDILATANPIETSNTAFVHLEINTTAFGTYDISCSYDIPVTANATQSQVIKDVYDFLIDPTTLVNIPTGTAQFATIFTPTLYINKVNLVTTLSGANYNLPSAYVIQCYGYNSADSNDNSFISWWTPNNWYNPSDFAFLSQIEVGKEPSWREPQVSLKKDSSRTINNIRNKTFQFRVKYYYDDHEYTALSPISDIPVDISLAGANNMLDTENNYVQVDYSDNRYSIGEQAWQFTGRLQRLHGLITSADIFVRTSNTDDFLFVAHIDKENLSGVYNFYNDGQYAAISGIESAKNYDTLPVKSETQEYVNNRINYGNNTEGYPTVNNLQTDFNVSWSGSNNLYDITVKVRLYKWKMSGKSTDAGDIGTFAQYNQLGGIGDSLGFWVFLSGVPYYAKTEQVSGFEQTATIKNVPNGVYYMRLASHYCSDKSDVGSKYLVAPDDLSWQQTSTFTRGIATDVSLGDLVADDTIRVEVNNADVVCSSFFAVDVQVPDGGGSNAIITYGYNTDMLLLPSATSPNTTDVRLLWNGIEKSSTYLYYQDSGGGLIDTQIVTTDSRGFFYTVYWYSTAIAHIQSHSTTITESSKETYQNSYVGNISPEMGTLTSGLDLTAQPAFYMSTPTLSDFVNKNNIIPNYYVQLSTNARSRVEGYITFNGLGVNGIVVADRYCGRYAKTDSNGFYSILIYVNDYTIEPTSNTRVEVAPANANRQQLILGGSNYSYAEILISSLTYNNDVPYIDNPNTYFTLALIGTSYPKHGEKYQVGIVYYDRINRDNYVNVGSKSIISIPYFTEGINAVKNPVVSWSIYSDAPSWATHYQWVRTKGHVYGNYLQFAINDVDYINGIKSDGTYTVGALSASTIYVRMYLKTLDWYKTYYPNTNVGYSFQKGDRVRLKRRGDNTQLWFDKLYDYEIVSYDSSKFAVLIALPADYYPQINQLVANSEIELYTPQQEVVESTYYEFGECYETYQNAGRTLHRGGYNGQDQELTSAYPATGTFVAWDTYVRNRVFALKDGSDNLIADGSLVYIEESKTLNDIDTTALQNNIGRPNAINPTNAQVQKITGLRYSNPYQIDSSNNGLSSFEALNRKDIDISYGALRKLIYNDNVMLAICENRTFSVYVEKNVLVSADGSTSVTASNIYYNTIRELGGNYGTIHPESVKEHRGFVIWFDAYRGVPIRYQQDGLQPIMPKMKQYFSNKGKLLLQNPTKKVVAGIHRFFDEYIIAFPAMGSDSAETLSYNNTANRWITKFGYAPEQMCAIGVDMVSFPVSGSNRGQLYIHKKNSSKNTFYGTATDTKVKYAVNSKPTANKLYQSMNTESNGAVNVAITTPTIAWGNLSQASSLATTDFELMDNTYFASFLCDSNTPNVSNPLIEGDNLSGLYLLAELSKTSTTLFYILLTNTFFFDQDLTN